ncbi:hypothetical protein KDH_58910 [Dictyobacter sp. S3.2.2.5]|uniref:Uncharacterized protein n=1 Tax=Dictyobacter halimunensis TaxID=3026934 RepID=A0ABQ6G359_9CHLR|nr:hypothetical protein KDH_58910 [Dictyobacter sp. S3.2.2.5]
MNNCILPAHEFFIFVPTRSDGHRFPSVNCMEKHTAFDTHNTHEDASAPMSLHSWTKIAVADTLDVYARLREGERHVSSSK